MPNSAATVASSPLVLDVGGEGRHPQAWNLNPRRRKTIGPDRGQPIPRLIIGRGDAIPLADASVDVLIAERVPLRPATLAEMLRVAKSSATIILRHAQVPNHDPHRLAIKMLIGSVRRSTTKIGRQNVQETVIVLAPRAV